MKYLCLSILVVLVVFTSSSLFAETESRLPLHLIKLPPGFKIDVYAPHVSNAREMAWGERGTLFVGSRRAGNVYAVVDRDGGLAAAESDQTQPARHCLPSIRHGEYLLGECPYEPRVSSHIRLPSARPNHKLPDSCRSTPPPRPTRPAVRSVPPSPIRGLLPDRSRFNQPVASAPERTPSLTRRRRV